MHDKNIYSHSDQLSFCIKNLQSTKLVNFRNCFLINSEKMAGGEADKLRLLRIAMEGFNMLDAWSHRPNGWAVEARRQNQHVPQARVYYPVSQAAPGKAAAGSVIDSNEAARMYGGMVIAGYPK